MLKSFLGLVFVSVIFVSCSPWDEPISLAITPDEIDSYVAAKCNPSEIYDISTSMRFSRNDGHAYSVTRYNQQDTTIMFSEVIEEKNGITYRSTFFKQGLPVYVEELFTNSENGMTTMTERKVYLNGAIILKALERKATHEEDIESLSFQEITMMRIQFDFDKPVRAMNQQKEFEMKFEEFLTIEGSASYLVLENSESGYSAALLLYEPDQLIQELYSDPEKYKGKTIFAYHNYMQMGGMTQMIYTGGEIK